MYGSSPAMTKDLNLPFSSESVQHHQIGSGLIRYRSAPSSLLGDVSEELLPHRPSTLEAQSMFGRLLGVDPHMAEKLSGQRSTTQFVSSMEDGSAARAPPPLVMFHSQQQQQQQQLLQSLNTTTAPAAPSTNPGVNLIRQSSSPAGFFSHLNVDSGEHYRGRLKGQMSFPSRQGSGGFMAQISEDDDEHGNGDDPIESGMTRSYMPGYQSSSWEDAALLSEGFGPSGRKRGRNALEAENGGDVRSHHQLTQHLSLPRSSPEMEVERLLHFQEAVPCMVRAKRGCATHPRSIAERVRRTKISERIRKLQELVPNMDKQTSTADMLELAVEYIKDLQKTVQTLTDEKANCICSNNQKL